MFGYRAVECVGSQCLHRELRHHILAGRDFDIDTESIDGEGVSLISAVQRELDGFVRIDRDIPRRELEVTRRDLELAVTRTGWRGVVSAARQQSDQYDQHAEH